MALLLNKFAFSHAFDISFHMQQEVGKKGLRQIVDMWKFKVGDSKRGPWHDKKNVGMKRAITFPLLPSDLLCAKLLGSCMSITWLN